MKKSDLRATLAGYEANEQLRAQISTTSLSIPELRARLAPYVRRDTVKNATSETHGDLGKVCGLIRAMGNSDFSMIGDGGVSAKFNREEEGEPVLDAPTIGDDDEDDDDPMETLQSLFAEVSSEE